jgi:hypothetical protein
VGNRKQVQVDELVFQFQSLGRKDQEVLRAAAWETEKSACRGMSLSIPEDYFTLIFGRIR